jgi:hypothetical protein
MLGSSMPTAPMYATQVLNQPMQEAESIAERIISQNLAR